MTVENLNHPLGDAITEMVDEVIKWNNERMTDEQIIKALECCGIDNHIGVCTECPFTDICDEDEQALQKYALDLINRQKAEIERLERVRKYLCRINKGEVAKAFAEKVKKEFKNTPYWGRYAENRLDKFVEKEMVGEKNDRP